MIEINMILKEEYTITPELYHDFHVGGLDNKQPKMLEGKLGKKWFKMFLIENNIPFIEDHSSPQERDEYDYLLRTTC